MSRRVNKYIDNKVFIKAYLAHDHNTDVALELGVTDITVAMKATRLRKFGVKLPHRTERRPTLSQVEEMNEIIEAIESTKRLSQ